MPADGMSPMALWDQAHEQYPDDAECRKALYHDLMVAHGHIVSKTTGDNKPLLVESMSVEHDGCPYLAVVVQSGVWVCTKCGQHGHVDDTEKSDA